MTKYYVIVQRVAYGPYYTEADAKLVCERLGTGEVVQLV